MRSALLISALLIGCVASSLAQLSTNQLSTSGIVDAVLVDDGSRFQPRTLGSLFGSEFEFVNGKVRYQSAWETSMGKVYTTGNNVGINTSNPQYSLHVNGTMFLGDRTILGGANNSTAGERYIDIGYISGHTLSSISTMRSTGNWAFGFATAARRNASGLASTANNIPWPRGLMEVGRELKMWVSGAQSVPVGDPITLSLAMHVRNDGRVLFGDLAGSGTRNLMAQADGRLVTGDGDLRDAGKLYGRAAPQRLGTGTPSSGNVLRGDGSWGGIDAGTLTTGVIDAARLPSFSADGGNAAKLQGENPSYYLARANHTGGLNASVLTTGELDVDRLPNLDASQTTSGRFTVGRLGTGTANVSTVLRGNLTWGGIDAGTITTGVIDAARLPSFSPDGGNASKLQGQNPAYYLTRANHTGGIDAGIITTGQLSVSRLPSLDANQTTSGRFTAGRMGTGTANVSTVLRGNLTWGGIDAGTITTGRFSTSRLGSGTANGSTLLRGDGTWGGIAASSITSGVIDAARLPSFSPDGGNANKLQGENPSYYLARANHTGGLDAGTITTGRFDVARLVDGTPFSDAIPRWSNSQSKLVWGAPSGGSDNLGSHDASQRLNMNGNPILSAQYVEVNDGTQTRLTGQAIVYGPPGGGIGGSSDGMFSFKPNGSGHLYYSFYLLNGSSGIRELANVSDLPLNNEASKSGGGQLLGSKNYYELSGSSGDEFVLPGAANQPRGTYYVKSLSNNIVLKPRANDTLDGGGRNSLPFKTLNSKEAFTLYCDGVSAWSIVGQYKP